MKKFLFASAFTLFGTYAMANDYVGYTIQIDEIAECCTAKVYYEGVLVKSFTECGWGSDWANCGLARQLAENWINSQEQSAPEE